MQAPVMVLLIAIACIGAGAVLLAVLGTLSELQPRERIPWSFAVGLGAMGWMLFFLGVAGWYSYSMLTALCFVAAVGCFALVRTDWSSLEAGRIDMYGLILCAGIFVALVFDLFEGISPPADADSLAYHFALPKQFVAAGRLEFVPRAADGAAPMLIHMSYLLALALGGEPGLTLWAMVSGWLACLLLFVLARRHLDLNWSLAVALVFLTTPAVVYGGGSGQVETRLVLFVLVAAFAAAEAVRTGNMRYVALAGLAARFFAGAKYTGLLFAAACCLPLLIGHRWFARGAVFSLAALIAGGQWYAWNWYHTGDPIFPLLFAPLGFPDSEIWNLAQDAYFRSAYLDVESPVPLGPLGLLAYPFQASLGLVYAFESSRTGMGPFGLLILPFALGGGWRFRGRLRASGLMVPAVIAIAFYVAWYFSGSSQRVRHLLPVYPLLLIGLSVATQRWVAGRGYLGPAAAVMIMTIPLQLAGHGIFALNYLRAVWSGESRNAFLRRTVMNSEPAIWINAHLSQRDKVLLTERQLVYLMKIPVYYAHRQMDALVEIRPDSTNPSKFIDQLRKQNVSHILVTDYPGALPAGAARSGFEGLTSALEQANCAQLVRDFDLTVRSSRTLPDLAVSTTKMKLLAIKPSTCQF